MWEAGGAAGLGRDTQGCVGSRPWGPSCACRDLQILLTQHWVNSQRPGLPPTAWAGGTSSDTSTQRGQDEQGRSHTSALARTDGHRAPGGVAGGTSSSPARQGWTPGKTHSPARGTN